MIKKIILMLVLICTPLKAGEWKDNYKEPLSETDIKGIYAFNVLQFVDMLQTLEIANNDAYYEKNKIMGKHPSEFQVVTYFIARGFAHYEATKMIPAKYRKIWHTYNIVYNYDVIRNNHDIGIRIDF
jgi:hypothetical protein|tara:strand:- start:1159 stop:1539 length:381 start_codon:yes stop_codon:yes gene_type:complete